MNIASDCGSTRRQGVQRLWGAYGNPPKEPTRVHLRIHLDARRRPKMSVRVLSGGSADGCPICITNFLFFNFRICRSGSANSLRSKRIHPCPHKFRARSSAKSNPSPGPPQEWSRCPLLVDSSWRRSDAANWNAGRKRSADFSHRFSRRAVAKPRCGPLPVHSQPADLPNGSSCSEQLFPAARTVHSILRRLLRVRSQR